MLAQNSSIQQKLNANHVPVGTLQQRLDLRLLALSCELHPQFVFHASDMFEGLERHSLLQSAVWAKQQKYTRLSHVLLALAANAYVSAPSEGKSLVRSLLPQIIQTAEQACAFYVQWQQMYPGKALSNALKKGLAEVLAQAAENQAMLHFAPQDTLRQLLRLVHPRPKSQTASDLFRQILCQKPNKTMSLSEVLSKALKQTLSLGQLSGYIQSLDLRLFAQRYQLLCLHRALEDDLLQAACVRALKQTASTFQSSGKMALIIESGASMLLRNKRASFLQILDEACFTAALIAENNQAQSVSVATELCFNECGRSTVDNALAWRQQNCGWGNQLWKAFSELEPDLHVLIFFASQDIQTTELAAWERYLSVSPQTKLIWVNLPAQPAYIQWNATQQRYTIQGFSKNIAQVIGLCLEG